MDAPMAARRCEVHGLAVGPDGSCVLCRRGEHRTNVEGARPSGRPSKAWFQGIVLLLLGCTLYALWPSGTIDALRHDPDAVLRFPWQKSDAADEPTARNPVTVDGPAALETPPHGALRVLFVGNSHTHFNDMPSMIAGLAAATLGARPFFFRMEAPGGARLIEHVSAGQVARQLAAQRFDYVVLQEQQQWPSFNRGKRQREFESPANTLDVMIRAASAKTWLFLTWARREGDRPNVPDDTYEAMQVRVRDGYRDAARVLGAPVVPVGLVWRQVVSAQPDLVLWQSDGSHATPLGSYLAACVFYKAFYDRSPEGNRFTAGLAPQDAVRLQRAAGSAKALYSPSEL